MTVLWGGVIQRAGLLSGPVLAHRQAEQYSSSNITSHGGKEEKEQNMMRTTIERVRLALWSVVLWKDTRGQDLVEYALLAGFVAVAAGALLPTISQSVSKIFSRMSSVLTAAAS